MKRCPFCNVWTQLEPTGLCSRCMGDSRKIEQIVREWSESKDKTICDACGEQIQDDDVNVGHECDLHKECVGDVDLSVAYKRLIEEHRETIHLIVDREAQLATAREALETIVDVSPHTGEDAVVMHDIAADAVKEG